MAIIIDETMTVGQVVAAYPQCRQILEELGIDYCCGGKVDLKTAAEAKELNVQDVIEKLKAATANKAGEGERDWTTGTLTELAGHIEAKHHAFTKAQLPRLALMLAKVKRAHNLEHGQMLTELEDVFLSLREEIEEHLAKEERVLFPYIRQIEEYAVKGEKAPEGHCGTVVNPIRQMEYEHEAAGRALAAMRKLTDNYTLPGDGCQTFAALYEGLSAMEKDLHQHIHLENNVLFPRAVELEGRIGAGKR